MFLKKLNIHSLRNIQNATIEPGSGINLIIGENASGKSSLLEAIFILGRARSFRATHIKQAIKFDQPQLIVSGITQNQFSQDFHLGIQIDSKGIESRINQENCRKADLAHSLPVLLIHPKSYKLLDAGPQIRREFLDWGVFNFEQSFLENWRKYKKILQQRNSLLKTKQINHINVWDIELDHYGSIIAQHRKDYISILEPLFVEVCQYFLSFDSIELQYLPGWDESISFKQHLINDNNKDLRYGFTHSGPHRSDFLVKVNGRLAKDFVSRGQLKLLMLSLKLAQVKLVNTNNDIIICLLIDDLTAELDSLNKQKLLNYLSILNCQVFMSTTELSNFGDLSELGDFKVFHVEHGEIKLQYSEICST